MKRTETALPLWLLLVCGLAVVLVVNSVASYRWVSQTRRVGPARIAISAAVYRVAAYDPSSRLPVQSSANRLRWALWINASAAIALVLALAIAGVRFRSHVRSSQSARHLEIARRIQANLLPAARQQILDGLEVAADCLPSVTVGGDFYDVLKVPGSGPAFVLGDVCGNGLPAAMLMGVLHGAVRSSPWTESGSQHEAATGKINQLLCRLASSERSATMFWSYFDAEAQLLRYINTGHFPPLLFKASRREIVPLRHGGPLLGVATGAAYEQASVRFEPGDMLVIYSGGVVQARDHNQEPFGRERLLSVVALSRGKSAEEIRDRILSSVRAFTGNNEAGDDRTLLVIRYSGPRISCTPHAVQEQPALERA